MVSFNNPCYNFEWDVDCKISKKSWKIIYEFFLKRTPHSLGFLYQGWWVDLGVRIMKIKDKITVLVAGACLLYTSDAADE